MKHRVGKNKRTRKDRSRRSRKARKYSRKQRGGDEADCKKYEGMFMMLKKKLQINGFTSASDMHFLLDPELDLEMCSAKYFPDLKERLLRQPDIAVGLGSTVSFLKENLSTIFPNKTIPPSFLRFLEFTDVKDCSVHELMESTNPYEECSSRSLENVKGSCAYPSFLNKSALRDYDKERVSELLQLFSAIESKLSTEAAPVYFDIVVGAEKQGEFSSAFPDKTNAYCLFLNHVEEFESSLENLLNKIREEGSLKGKEHKFKRYFPLSYTRGPNNRVVLDKLVEMNRNGIHVRFTNRMCGTCFPSFYYLAQRGIAYKMFPSAELSGSQNTPAIRSCFVSSASSNNEESL
jgi:hypothetical protein